MSGFVTNMCQYDVTVGITRSEVILVLFFCCNSLLQVPGYQPEEGTAVKDGKAEEAMLKADTAKAPEESSSTEVKDETAKAPEESSSTEVKDETAKVPAESSSTEVKDETAKGPEESSPEESSPTEVNDVAMTSADVQDVAMTSADVKDLAMVSTEVKVEQDEVDPSVGPKDVEMASPTSPADEQSVDSVATKVSERTILPPDVIAEKKDDSDMKGNIEVKHETVARDEPTIPCSTVSVPCSTVREPMTFTEAGTTLNAFSFGCNIECIFIWLLG